MCLYVPVKDRIMKKANLDGTWMEVNFQYGDAHSTMSMCVMFSKVED